MTSLHTTNKDLNHHPIDIVEQLAEFNEWNFDRRSDEEVAVQVPGSWCDYSLHFAWNSHMEAIHFTCAFDIRVTAIKKARVHELLALINEKLWLGHFIAWSDEDLLMFRTTLPLRGQHGMASEQTEDLIETALIECERFFPVFQYVIWGGQPAAEAIEAAMINTVGEA